MKGCTDGDQGEFGLIRAIRERVEERLGVIKGIGDDAAILQPPQGEMLLTIDMLIEGVHFDLRYFDAFRLGRKCIGVSLSDIAAMGGRSLYSVVSLGLREGLGREFVLELYRGMEDQASRWQVSIVGGDTVKSPGPLVIDVAVVGEGARPLTRGGARPGQHIGVTGHLGLSAAGLGLLQRGVDPQRCLPHEAEAIRRHLEPVPRCEAGLALAGIEGVTACIDISDGLSSEVNHICDESKVGAVIEAERLPICTAAHRVAAHLGVDALELALSGGEDYELLFTFDPEAEEEVIEALSATGTPMTVIGKVLEQGQGRWLVKDSHRRPLLMTGFDHFRRDG
ncbi:MAG: thiamine-phosphate kinase [Bacillota bacterium]